MADTIEADLKYFVPPADGSMPYQYINANPASGVRDRNFTEVLHKIPIENVRGKEDSCSLDTTGFQFFTAPAKYKAFTSDSEVMEEYYPETIELLKVSFTLSGVQEGFQTIDVVFRNLREPAGLFCSIIVSLSDTVFSSNGDLIHVGRQLSVVGDRGRLTIVQTSVNRKQECM